MRKINQEARENGLIRTGVHKSWRNKAGHLNGPFIGGSQLVYTTQSYDVKGGRIFQKLSGK